MQSDPKHFDDPPSDVPPSEEEIEYWFFEYVLDEIIEIMSTRKI